MEGVEITLSLGVEIPLSESEDETFCTLSDFDDEIYIKDEGSLLYITKCISVYSYTLEKNFGKNHITNQNDWVI